MSGNKSDNSVVDEEFVEVPEKTMEEEPESQPISCAEGTLTDDDSPCVDVPESLRRLERGGQKFKPAAKFGFISEGNRTVLNIQVLICVFYRAYRVYVARYHCWL